MAKYYEYANTYPEDIPTPSNTDIKVFNKTLQKIN